MNENKETKAPKPAGSPFGARPGGMGGMGGNGEKAKNFKGTMAQLAAYLKPFRVGIIVVIIFAIASTTFSIVSPKILGNMTNDIVDDYINMQIYDQVTAKLPTGYVIPAGTTGAQFLSRASADDLSKIPASNLAAIKALDFSMRPQINFDRIAPVALTLLGLYILSLIFSYIMGWIMAGVAQKISYQFRKDLSDKINKLPLKYFDSRTNGDVLSRITNDVDTLSQSLNQSMTSIITSVTQLIGILIMMLTINWLLTIVALVMLPISLGLVGFVIKKSQHLFKEQQDSLGRINGHIEEMYSGHSIVKVFNGEERALATFTGINTELYGSAWKSQFFSGLLYPITGFIGNIGYVAIAVLGGYLAINGTIKIGDIQAFIQYMQQFNQPIMQVANIVNVLQSTAAAAERVFEFLAEKNELAETENPVVLKDVKGNVQFDNVVFGYSPEKIIIKGFSTDVKAGQRIAIVGPTGAGKTTMVNLLMRFYDVDKGAIKVDGVDIRDMKRADLRRMFGMVLQDTWLFNGTIRENLMYGKPEATEAELQAVTKAAHVDHFIHSLPGGYDMVINEEADNISQGEKQLLTIARAMLANPPMLILDEATSSVDTRTEVLIQKAMDNLMHGRTSFVIAHRLSTIKNADLILVMNEGNIVEQGNHEELMAKNGFYAGLYNSQFSE